MEINRNRRFGAIMLLFGLIAVWSALTLDNPRLSTLRFSDWIRLVGAGGCIGIGLVALVGRFNDKKD
jgi:hypothetical protein